MPNWLMLMIIVLVGVALFADLRRNDAEERGAAGRKFPRTNPDLLLRPNVRDVIENGHRGTVPRPLSVRRAGQDVRKRG